MLRAAASSAEPALPGGPAPADAECEARDGPAPAHTDPPTTGETAPEPSWHQGCPPKEEERSEGDAVDE